MNATLNATGTHTILIDPQNANAGSVTLTLTASGGSFAAHSLPSALTLLTGPAPAALRSPAATTGGAEDVPVIDYPPGTVEEWLPSSSEPSTWFSGRSESPFEFLPLPEAAPGVTAVAGQVLRLDGLPLAGATVRSGAARAVTDRAGRFLLEDVQPGRAVVTVDATTADRPGASYGVYEFGVATKRNRTSELPFTVWSARLDTEHRIELEYPLRKDVVLKSPLIPGLEIKIPAGSEVHDRQGRPIRKLGITPVPLDRSAFPMPSRFPVYFTVQPGAAYVWPHGVEVVYPNKMHARPGQRVEFYTYDPQEKGWHVYGKGSVTGDGKQIRFDPGTRQYELTSSGVCLGCVAIGFGGGFVFGWILDGDPVDLATGTLTLPHTDLVEQGSPQLDVTRVYRSNDPTSRAFGVGGSMTYSMALYQPDSHNYSWADLVFADGSRVRYERISPGTGYTDMVLEARATPSRFYKSRILWNGRAWELTLSDGTAFTFPNGGLLESVRDRFGNQTTIVRSSQFGDISQVLSSSGRWLKFSYGGSGRVSQVQDQSGCSVGYTYDGAGRLWKVTDARGGVTEYTYDAGGRLASVKDPRNIVWLQNHYDGNGRIDSQTLPDGGVYQFAYTTDGNGKVTQTDVTNPRGYLRRVTCNSDGYPLSDTLAVGTPRQQATGYQYQAGTNLLLSETDQRNRRTEYEYNTVGRLTKITKLAGTGGSVSTTFAYEPSFNQLTSVSDPLGHGPSFQYDTRGALIKVTDARGKETTIVPNNAGLPLTASDPLGKQTTYTYALGDVTSSTDPRGATARFFHDNAGRITRVTDAVGRLTRYAYDAADAFSSVTDAAGNATAFERDDNGNLTKLTDAKQHDTVLTYDSMDRTASRKDPLLKTETFARDNGNRLTQAVDSAYGTITRAYDELDRLTSETSEEGSIAYTYDAADRRQTMTVTGQPQVSYAYNNADQLTSLTRSSLSVALAYDDLSRLQALTLPDAIVQSYTYDDASRLTGITYQHGGQTIGDLIYGNDANGLRTGIGGSYARTGLPPAVTSVSHDAANRLTSWAGQSLTYDDNGAMTAHGATTFSWNARGELTSLSGGGTSASFAYDPFGRRARTTIDGAVTRYLYDVANIVQELSSSLAAQTNLVSGQAIDELFALIDDTGTRTVLRCAREHTGSRRWCRRAPDALHL